MKWSFVFLEEIFSGVPLDNITVEQVLFTCWQTGIKGQHTPDALPGGKKYARIVVYESTHTGRGTCSLFFYFSLAALSRLYWYFPRQQHFDIFFFKWPCPWRFRNTSRQSSHYKDGVKRFKFTILHCFKINFFSITNVGHPTSKALKYSL